MTTKVARSTRRRMISNLEPSSSESRCSGKNAFLKKRKKKKGDSRGSVPVVRGWTGKTGPDSASGTTLHTGVACFRGVLLAAQTVPSHRSALNLTSIRFGLVFSCRSGSIVIGGHAHCFCSIPDYCYNGFQTTQV